MKNEEKNKKYRQMAREKRNRIRARVLSGELVPKYWKTCAHCGGKFPYYNNYIQHETSVTCSEWLTGKKCSNAYRANRVAAAHGGDKRDNYRPKKTDCRAELCNKSPICANISSCLDLEITNPGTIPLKADGSCKKPVTGIDSEHYRLRGASYGHGSAHYI